MKLRNVPNEPLTFASTEEFARENVLHLSQEFPNLLNEISAFAFDALDIAKAKIKFLTRPYLQFQTDKVQIAVFLALTFLSLRSVPGVKADF